MKKIKIISIVILQLFLIFSCSKIEKNPLIGKWEGYRYDESGNKWNLTMEFFEDSTYIDEFHQKKKYYIPDEKHIKYPKYHNNPLFGKEISMDNDESYYKFENEELQILDIFTNTGDLRFGFKLKKTLK